MDGVLELDAAEFREVDDWLYRGSLSAKRLIKDLIRMLDRELEWRGREDSMSLRGLWYSGVKTALQRAFPEKWDDPEFDSNRRYAQYLSEYLSEMVKDGETSYRQLNIVDDSRQREIAADTIEDDKILFIEKEAAYRRLLPIQRVFEISLVSGGGWEATALIEDMSNALEPGQEYQLFVLSDYDPTGYQIADDFEARAQRLGVDITDVERIGIEPEQVSDRVRRQERFEVPNDSEYDQRWLDRRGLEDDSGVPRYGLEIEAIGDVGEGGRPLREIVVEDLRPHLRLRERRRADLNVAAANAAYWSVQRLIDELTDDLERALLDFTTDEMRDQPHVRTCRPNESYSGVAASVEEAAVDGHDGEYLPDALDATEYVECAVDAPTDDDGELQVVSPGYTAERSRLKAAARKAIENGDIDVSALLRD
jgi:hypothetical protein